MQVAAKMQALAILDPGTHGTCVHIQIWLYLHHATRPAHLWTLMTAKNKIQAE